MTKSTDTDTELTLVAIDAAMDFLHKAREECVSQQAATAHASAERREENVVKLLDIAAAWITTVREPSGLLEPTPEPPHLDMTGKRL